MTKKYFAESELIINKNGSIFHLHVKPEQLADKVILVGDPGRVALVASHFENKEAEVESREFRTVTGTYKGKRITVISTGIGCDNIDIVMNEVDALANIDFKTREEKSPTPKSRNRENRYLRRLAAEHPGRNIHLFGIFCRVRRSPELLRRTQCRLRFADGTCPHRTLGVDWKHVPAIPIHHKSRRKPYRTDCTERHGARHHGGLRRFLRTTRQRTAHPPYRPASKRKD